MKTVKQEVIFTTTERPEDVPSDWLVFNAPRPIWGDKVWQGEFLSGIFYAAVNPDYGMAKGYITENIRLNACPVEYITTEFKSEWVKKFCEDNGYDFSDLDDYMIRSTFYYENKQFREYQIPD